MSRSICGICLCTYGDAGDCGCVESQHIRTQVDPVDVRLLTDEEISDIAISNPPNVHIYARAIEQAVWEKLGVTE